MNIEINLLQALSNKENYFKYKYLLNPKSLSIEGLTILQDYNAFFKSFVDIIDITFDKFSTFFFVVRHPNIDEKSIEFYKEVLNLVFLQKNEDSIKDILIAFEQREYYQDIISLLEKNVDFNTIKDKISVLDSRIKNINTDLTINQNMNIDEALEAIDRTDGLVWRMKSLRDHFNGGLIKGDFIIVAGYTDSGKTSLLASELSYMAQQLSGDQYILWLNNEGAWKRILPRIYCATLNCTVDYLRKFKDAAKAKYKSMMKNNENRIKVVDIQNKSTVDIERLIEKNPPSLIVFDLLDHLTGYEQYISKDDSTGRYKKLYQWARQIAEVCPIIAVSQLNRTDIENNNCYPSITNLEGSGSPKQSAATVVLMIGMQYGHDSVRYLSTPKFKNGANKSWRAEVKFDSNRSRFISMGDE